MQAQIKQQKHLEDFIQLLKLIIKYNSMATSTKVVCDKIESRRRTLRSGAIHPPESIESVGCSKDDKIINQIQIEIQHQQIINVTKSTFPVQEDIKNYQVLLADKDESVKNISNSKILKNKCSASDSNIFSLKPSQLSQQAIENSLEEKIKSNQQLQKLGSDMLTPPAKSHLRNLKKTQSSPYHDERKSYRKIKKHNVSLVPYRKCQDQFQHKIVVFLNKICQNKHTYKEIENLTERIQKIPSKDIYNPYVISGIQTILNLLQKTHPINAPCLAKLKSQVKNLSSKILMQLGKIDSYQTVYHEQNKVDVDLIKPKMMRKICKILSQQRKGEMNDAKSMSVNACEAFFSKCRNQTTHEELICFLKESRFLQY